MVLTFYLFLVSVNKRGSDLALMSNNEFFQFKTGFTGGTELMAQLFHERVGPFLPLAEKFNCILLPGVISLPSYHSLLEQDKDIVLWLHNNPNEFLPPVNIDFFRNSNFHKKLRKVVTVSEYAKQILIEQSGISAEKVVVIHNAINQVPVDAKKYTDLDRPKLIYVSQPERGLVIALHSLHQRKENFTFDIYGDVPEEFLLSLPRGILTDERFVFHGRRPHDDILNTLAKAHVFVYPAIWYETFCVSLVEALAAGCIAVYNLIGSLPEVGMGYGITYQHTDLGDIEGHCKKLNQALDKAFELMNSGPFELLNSSAFNPKSQIEAARSNFSEEKFITSWFGLAAELLST